jgi:sec-independent protein translocase protein TatB
MFNLSGSEIVFLLLLALIVLGPEKLPEAIRKFGKVYAEVKKMGAGFQSELKSALDEPMREMRETADAIKQAAKFEFPDSYYDVPAPVPEADADAAAASTTEATAEPTTDEPAAPEVVAAAEPTDHAEAAPEPAVPVIEETASE